MVRKSYRSHYRPSYRVRFDPSLVKDDYSRFPYERMTLALNESATFHCSDTRQRASRIRLVRITTRQRRLLSRVTAHSLLE